MKYDLHIHSALSPCCADDMTPNNIINMSIIKGLDVISVTDHNAIDNQKVIGDVAHLNNLKYIYGIEVQTIEEVHILCYFEKFNDLSSFGKYIENNLIKFLNDEKYFGKQLIYDQNDVVIGKYPNLLINSVNQPIEKIIEQIRVNNGYVILAHPLSRKNGIITMLGFIPKNLDYDGVEIMDLDQKKQLIEIYKIDENKLFLINSDAHQLIDIAEDNQIDTLFKGMNNL